MNDDRKHLESLLDVAKAIRGEFTDDNGAYHPQTDSDGEKWPNERLFRKLEKTVEEAEQYLKSATQS